jgi:ribosomal protein S18 acetylase RimI-like enzyme
VSLRVRPARPTEYDAIGALTADVYAAESLAGPAYVETLRDARVRAATPGTELLVAVPATSDAPLLGAVTVCLPGSPWAMDAKSDEAEVRMLVVAPSARRSGIGEALVRACIDRAGAAGAARLVLMTKEVMAVAVRLYQRLGFRRVPERDRTPRPDVVLLAYALDLCPRDSSSGSPNRMNTTQSVS